MQREFLKEYPQSGNDVDIVSKLKPNLEEFLGNRQLQLFELLNGRSQSRQRVELCHRTSTPQQVSLRQ